ncbi:MAG: aldo/keto reductase [Marinovum algicola]|jgi:2,5-diketo-D-gluconate reductase A|uniref:2,5-diketo-D-gluconate reductase A n=1 Tax=Marinovum algicola TaxID=42444 RepID=A0A975WCY9_9RHOB|nr:aldo/keto reductase [Marinovum algicola]SEJ96477.1 2,5-diketo-D-gluconate reductase A [Marinovum algicola]SLN69414.1 putative oxidoreductase/MSMEI_2347 [Marinovum algicola]
MTDIRQLPLNDDRHLPQLGIGVWQIDDATTPGVVSTAVELGVRLIDGAFIYGNEASMGEGIRQALVSRDALFVTSKVWNADQGYDSARAAIDGSLGRIGLDYLDLALIHWPCPARDQYVETWRALIDARAAGKVRSIGVSNFNPDHLDRLIDETGVTPAVNQIEINPRFQNAGVRAANDARGIVSQAWTPLGNGKSFDAPAIREAAARSGKSPAQVILRWHVQLGHSVIPRSTKRDHLASNLDVMDFELTGAEMAAVAALEAGARCGPDPESFEAE